MHSTNMASPKPSRKRLVSRVLHLDTRAKVLLNSPSVSPDGSVIGESHSGPASAVAPYSPVRLTRGRPRSLSGQLVTPWYSCVSPSMEEELVIPGPWWLDEQDDITGTHLSRYGHDGHGDLAEDIYPIATSPASSLSSGTSKLPLSTNAKLTRRPSRKLMVAVPDLRWIVRKCTPGSIENVPAVDESVSVQKTKQRTRSGSDAHSRLLALLATIRELNRTSFLPRAKRLVSRSDRRRSQSSRTTSDGFGESQKISSSDAPVTTKTEVQQVVHNFSSMKGAEVHNAIITGPSTGELLVNNIADDKTTEHENFPAVVPLVAKFMVKQRSDFPLQINRHHVPVSPISNKKQWSALFSDPKHVPANINSPKVPATIVIAKSRDKAKIPVKSSIAKGSKLANFNNPSINHDSEFKKKCRGLRKRLHAIEQLEARLEAGDVLELNQVEKVQTKTILQTELDDLLSSQERACQSGFELPRAQMPVQSVRNMFAGEIDVCNVSNAASEADGTWQTPKPKRRSRIKATQRLDAESVEVEACVKTLDGHELSGLELLEQESGKSHQSANSSLLDISLTATDIKEKPKELSVHQTISASAVEDHVEHNMPSSAPDVNPGKLDEQLVTPSISKNLAKNQRKRQMLKERKRKARTSEICTNTPETDAIVSSPAPATYSESSETNSCNSDDEMPWPQRFALLKVEADHRMQVCSDRHLGRIDGMIKEWNAFFPERAIDCNMSGIELPVSTSVTTTKPAEDFPIEDAFELRDHVEQADMLLDLCHTRLLQRIVEARERKNQELESSIQGVASNPIQPASLQESQAHPSSTKIEKSQVKECSFVAALPREMKHIVKLLGG